MGTVSRPLAWKRPSRQERTAGLAPPQERPNRPQRLPCRRHWALCRGGGGGSGVGAGGRPSRFAAPRAAPGRRCGLGMGWRPRSWPKARPAQGTRKASSPPSPPGQESRVEAPLALAVSGGRLHVRIEDVNAGGVIDLHHLQQAQVGGEAPPHLAHSAASAHLGLRARALAPAAAPAPPRSTCQSQLRGSLGGRAGHCLLFP